MATSYKFPIYTVYIVSGSTKYNVTPALVSVDRQERTEQMAQSVTLQLRNVKVGDKWLSSLIGVRDRVYVYADDGNQNGEVFRGYVWTRNYKSSLSNWDISLKCYDNLIYLQESEESAFFASGKSTKEVCKSLCDDWGIELQYSYESITHSKLVLRGALADIFTADILDLVKDRTGKKYAIHSEKDVMKIKTVGSNSTVYHLVSGKNVTQTDSTVTLDGMVTKVIILGKADSDKREPIEATVTGKTSEYGTLQKIIDRDENTSLADAKKEAQSIIDEDGSPKWEYEAKGPDIPWIRTGDMVHIDAGNIDSDLIVTAVDRSCDNKKKEMTLTLIKP